MRKFWEDSIGPVWHGWIRLLDHFKDPFKCQWDSLLRMGDSARYTPRTSVCRSVELVNKKGFCHVAE